MAIVNIAFFCHCFGSWRGASPSVIIPLQASMFCSIRIFSRQGLMSPAFILQGYSACLKNRFIFGVFACLLTRDHASLDELL